MICQTNTQLSLADAAVALGENLDPERRLLLRVAMADAAVALRNLREYNRTQNWKKANRSRNRELSRLSYHRTKVLKGRPKAISVEEKRRRRKAQRELRKPKINAQERLRAAEDPQFAVARSLRAGIRCALKRSRANKAYDTMTLVGCSLPDLCHHLESQFLPGMTWENRRHWHVDHFVPVTAFDLTNPEEQAWAFNYRNLRPFPAFDNRSKQNKLPTPLPDWLPTHITERILQRYAKTKTPPV